MAVKKDNINEEIQKFGSKYLSDTVNDMVNNITTATKLRPQAFRYLAEDNTELEYIPFGIPELDKGLSGGLPRKTVVEIYGPPGGGKSFLACYRSAASVTSNFGNVTVYDIENAFNRDRAESLGVATNRVMINNTFDTGEQVLSAICEQLYNAQYKKMGKTMPRWADLIILDSIAALGSRNEMEADFIQDIQGVDEKSGPKQMPAARARMISAFQGKMIRAINNSDGIWNEIMPCTFMPDNSLYSFLPVDKEIPESLLEDLSETIKVRQSIIDPKNPDLWKAVWYAQNRRDKLNKYVQELSKIVGDEALVLGETIENKNDKEYAKLKKIITDNYNCNKIMMKLDIIATEIFKGKNILPETQKSVKDFERMTNGYIYDRPGNKGLPVAHYNPGPTIIIINQVRIGNLASFTGPTIERPGGYAFKHIDGTVLYVTPMMSKSKGEVKSPDGQTTAGWKSNVLIEKSRFTPPKNNFEIVIPFTQDDIDAFSEFMSDCQKLGLWYYSRKTFLLPKDGSIIKTKDEEEWKTKLLEEGLAYLQQELKYSDDKMVPIYEALAEQVTKEILENESEEIEEDAEY